MNLYLVRNCDPEPELWYELSLTQMPFIIHDISFQFFFIRVFLPAGHVIGTHLALSNGC